MQDLRGDFRVIPVEPNKANPNRKHTYEDLLDSKFAKRHLAVSFEEARRRFLNLSHDERRGRHTFFIIEKDTIFYEVHGYMISSNTLLKVDFCLRSPVNTTSATDSSSQTPNTYAIWIKSHDHFDWRLWESYNRNHQMTTPARILRIEKINRLHNYQNP